MNKTKTLVVQILCCIALGTVLGTAFWLCDSGRTSKKVSDCPGRASNTQEMASKNKPVKVYPGKWHKDYLEVIGK